MPALFARRMVPSEEQVKIISITQYCEGKGIPIKKCPVKDEIALESIRNMLRVSVLEEDRLLCDLVSIFYLNSKPVYFSMTVLSDIKHDTCGKNYSVKYWKKS